MTLDWRAAEGPHSGWCIPTSCVVIHGCGHVIGVLPQTEADDLTHQMTLHENDCREEQQ